MYGDTNLDRRWPDADRRSRLAAAGGGAAARQRDHPPAPAPDLPVAHAAIRCRCPHRGHIHVAARRRRRGSRSSSPTERRAPTTWWWAPTASIRRCARRCSARSSRPSYTGQVCWRYNLPRIEGLDKIWVYIGATGTAGFVPLASDLMYILTIEKPPEGASLAPTARGHRRGLPRAAGAVRRAGGRARELIVDDDAVVYRPVENVLVAAAVVPRSRRAHR